MGMRIAKVRWCVRSDIPDVPSSGDVGVYAYHGEHSNRITGQTLLELFREGHTGVFNLSLLRLLLESPASCLSNHVSRERDGYGTAPSS